MITKTIFHVFALLSGIIVVASALTNSQNKIVYCVLFSVIAAAFEVAIPLLKISKYILPELAFSLQHIPSNYATGIQVDGLTWENDFSQYFLKIRNKKAEIQDLRIDIDFLGGVVKKEIRLQEGLDDIKFSADGFFNTGIGKNGQINRTFPSYSNNLKISCPKVYQDGYFEIKLILKDVGITENGLFEASYRYFDENNEQKKWANRYKILRRKNRKMYIDSENPFKDAVKRSLHMIPEKPLIFRENGTVEEKNKNN